MKKFICLLCFLVGPLAFASTNGYELNINYSIDGRIIASPRVKIKEGARALFTQVYKGKKNFVEVTATENPLDSDSKIHLAFVVGTFDRHGRKKIASNPSITTFADEKAQVIERDDKGREIRALNVIAKRKQLN